MDGCWAKVRVGETAEKKDVDDVENGALIRPIDPVRTAVPFRGQNT